jgi:hypothetical protein
MLLSILFSNTSVCSLLGVTDQVLHPFQNHRQNYSFVYSNVYILRRQNVLD